MDPMGYVFSFSLRKKCRRLRDLPALQPGKLRQPHRAEHLPPLRREGDWVGAAAGTGWGMEDVEKVQCETPHL